MMKGILIWSIPIIIGLLLYTFGSASQAASAEKIEPFMMCPVGYVHKGGTETTIEIRAQYQDGLLGLDGFSHMWVLWWFDRNDNPQKRAVLKVHPRGDPMNPLTGVFATRSPARPNLIAMTLCKIKSIHRCTIRVEDIDAFDNTPVLDLKPYIPRSDRVGKATVPSWISRK
jgi:tRNA-Thr(GGU) m(6)t(6)A37 methyltransferase TsaA